MVTLAWLLSSAHVPILGRYSCCGEFGAGAVIHVAVQRHTEVRGAFNSWLLKHEPSNTHTREGAVQGRIICAGAGHGNLTLIQSGCIGVCTTLANTCLWRRGVVCDCCWIVTLTQLGPLLITLSSLLFNSNETFFRARPVRVSEFKKNLRTEDQIQSKSLHRTKTNICWKNQPTEAQRQGRFLLSPTQDKRRTQCSFGS